MIPKSGNRFSEKLMRKQKARAGWRSKPTSSRSKREPKLHISLRAAQPAAVERVEDQPKDRSAASSGFRLNFRPGIPQAHGAIENEPTGLGVWVEAEVALALELHRLAGFQRRKRGFETRLSQHFERIRIDLGGEIAGVGVRPLE